MKRYPRVVMCENACVPVLLIPDLPPAPVKVVDPSRLFAQPANRRLAM